MLPKHVRYQAALHPGCFHRRQSFPTTLYIILHRRAFVNTFFADSLEFFPSRVLPRISGKNAPPARYVTAWFCANSVSLLGASSPNPCCQCGIWSAIIKVETPNARKGDKIITPGRDSKWKNGIQTNFQLTKQYGITPSMSRQGNPHDNAMAENFFSILKTECISRHKPTTFSEA